MSASPSTFPNHATNCSASPPHHPTEKPSAIPPPTLRILPPTLRILTPTPPSPPAYPTIPSRLPHHPLPPTIPSRQAKRQELYLDFLDVPGDDERRARDGVYHRWDISLPGGGVVRVLFLGE